MEQPVNIDENLLQNFGVMRDDRGHKNTFGALVISAGSEFMTGALSLATGSALRSGVGLVKVFSCDKALDVVRFHHPSAMTALVSDNQAVLVKQLDELIHYSTAVLCGPGIDKNDDNNRIILESFVKYSKRLVIDASALDILIKYKEEFFKFFESRRSEVAMMNTEGMVDAEEVAVREKGQIVLTPHVGEFIRLYNAFVSDKVDEKQKINDILSNDDIELKVRCMKKFVEITGCTLVLKDYRTLVCMSDGKVYTILGENSGLSKGGSGDVLAGLMAGMLAQPLSSEVAILGAVFCHVETAKILSLDKKYGKRYMLPSDITENLGIVYDRLGW